MPRRMLRTTGLLFGLFMLTVSVAPASEDPEFAGRRGSEWVQLLKADSSPRKRKAAVVALGQLWANGRYLHSIPTIGLALQQDSSPEVRVQAATVLGQLSRDELKRDDTLKSVVGDLVSALLAEKDSTVRRQIAVALGRFGDLSKTAVLGLTGVLKDGEAETRAAAAEALGRIGADAKSSAGELLLLVRDADRNVQRQAVFALGRVTPEEVEAVGSAFTQMLKDEKDLEMRRELVLALGLVGDHSESAANALGAAMADSDAEIRREAARALGRFGQEIEPAAGALLRAFQTDPDKNVRIDALRALGTGLGGAMSAHIPVLVMRLNMEADAVEKGDPDFEVRIAITDELGALGPVGRSAVPALRRSLRDPQVKVREAASQAIKKIEAPIEKKP